MKKLTSIFLGLFYLILSIGVNVNYHYCLGRLDSIEIFITDIHRCCEYEERLWSCCEDERFFFQLEEDHNLSPISSFVSDFRVSVHPPQIEIPVSPVLLSQISPIFPLEDAPPPSPEKAWLRFCSPIIYG
ncbi:MAG: hypothetical protein SF052_26590 [Bacteroidia bacterium]|nr:hypothetical protein [Bacteroidia bacterium]